MPKTLLKGKVEIKRGQVYVKNRTNFQIIIAKRKGDKWQVKVLSNKTNIFKGTHTLSPKTIYEDFELIT